MNLNNISNLIELFIKQFENQKDKQSILLSSLKDKNINFSWEKTFKAIYILSEEIKKYINKVIDVYWSLKTDRNGLFQTYR